MGANQYRSGVYIVTIKEQALEILESINDEVLKVKVIQGEDSKKWYKFVAYDTIKEIKKRIEALDDK